jgi:hypothetical protein
VAGRIAGGSGIASDQTFPAGIQSGDDPDDDSHHQYEDDDLESKEKLQL